MKQEVKKTLIAAFGSLPTREGYELVGVEMRIPQVGEFFHNTEWIRLKHKMSTQYPVAIFKAPAGTASIAEVDEYTLQRVKIIKDYSDAYYLKVNDVYFESFFSGLGCELEFSKSKEYAKRYKCASSAYRAAKKLQERWSIIQLSNTENGTITTFQQ